MLFRSLTYSIRRNEKGAALIIGLVLLMALTVLGVSVLSTTSLEQRMAGNMTDLNLAFNAAETAGRAFATHVKNSPGELENICQGLKTASCISSNLSPDWWEIENHSWWSANAISLGSTLFVVPLEGVNEQPQMIIEHKHIPPAQSGHKYPLGGDKMIILTTRGTGASNDTEVVIQQVITKQ